MARRTGRPQAPRLTTAVDEPQPGTPEWHALVVEPIVEPDIEIVDPHHHLWPASPLLPGYEVDDLVADTTSGHRVAATVFVECHTGYRAEGPEHLRPVGETEYVVAQARLVRERHREAAPVAAIVAHADLRHPDLDEVLDAHEAAGDGLFRGVRDALSSPTDDERPTLLIPGQAPAGLAADPAFRAGVRRLGERGLTYDTWHYHHQNREFLELARAVPETTMVLDHFGTPLGVGPWEGRHDEIFAGWAADITALATCDNVVCKLGGLAMPDNGFGWHTREQPPTSDEVVATQGRWYHHVIDTFGADRCMFESNFPVDRLSLSYPVLWNALKKIAARYTPAERSDLCAGTARRVYQL